VISARAYRLGTRQLEGRSRNIKQRDLFASGSLLDVPKRSLSMKIDPRTKLEDFSLGGVKLIAHVEWRVLNRSKN
jgi:hypothetical protein